jgi:xylan 1,4-beta-xylosidase
MKRSLVFALSSAFAVSLFAQPAAPVATPAVSAPAVPFPVTIRVDATQLKGEMKPIYRFFGADEPNYATMKDGRKLLGDIAKLGEPQEYFRAHNLLTSGDGTPALKWGSTDVYNEDANGKPIYDWKILDRIFDTYLERGVKPYVEIGFMPKALSTNPEPYQHEFRVGVGGNIYTGWAYPPKDYAKWGELVYQWAKRCVERYGAAEVEKWYWEVWNEANIGYWKGTPEEFYKLHDYAIAAVRRALPTARVGGPDSAGDGGKFMQDFLEHCLRGTNFATGEKGTPLDFIAFHAKGQTPTFPDGHVRMGIQAQLRGIDTAFRRFASFPELKNTPIIIGESDPDSCAACLGPAFAYRSGTMYSSYTAASFARKQLLAEKHGVNLEGAITWAFEFEDQPFFALFRVMSTNGLTLPVFNVHRMMAKMSGRRVETQSTGDIGVEEIIRSSVRGPLPDVAAISSLDLNRKQMTVLAWYYHDDDLRGPDAAVELAVTGLPAGVTRANVTHYRVDENHSNAFAVWQKMGSPIAPNRAQYTQLEAASQLATMTESPEITPITNGAATLKFSLPRQAVSLIVFDLQ